MIRHAAILLVLLVVGRVMAADPPDPVVDGRVIGASSNEHLYFVDRDDDALVLSMHAPTMEGPYWLPIVRLERRPTHVAAWGDRVWLLFEATPDGVKPRRFMTAQVFRHPMHGGYFAGPSGDAESMPDVPGDGSVVGFGAVASGPILALSGGAGDRLLRLRDGAWRAVELPASGMPGPTVEIVAGGDGHALVIVGRCDEQTLPVLRLDDLDAAEIGPGGSALVDPEWSVTHLPCPAGRELVAASRVGEVPMLVFRDRGAIVLSLLRPGRTVALGRMSEPREPWGMFGLRTGARLVARSEDGSWTTRQLDALGTLSPPEPLERSPISANSVLRGPIVLAVAIFAVILIGVLWPGPRHPIKLPETLVVASPMTRVAALVVDSVPGAFVALVWSDGAVRDLLWLPLLAPKIELATPYLIMTTLTVLIGFVGELTRGRSFGKALFGLEVRPVKGPRTFVRVTLRACGRFLVLALPPLGVLIFTNPNLQGLHDLLGRTVVVGPAPPADDDASSS